MTEIVLGLLAFALFCMIALIAFVVPRAFLLSSQMFEHVDRQQQRHKEQTDALLDRVMATDWRSFKEWQSGEQLVGGWEGPEGPIEELAPLTREEIEGLIPQ